MLEGTTSNHMPSSPPKPLVGLSEVVLLANAGGSTWSLRVSTPDFRAERFGNSRQHLSPERKACGECRRNYM